MSSIPAAPIRGPCFIIPNFLLFHVANNTSASEHSRACARQSLERNVQFSQSRLNICAREHIDDDQNHDNNDDNNNPDDPGSGSGPGSAPGLRRTIIPGYVHRDLAQTRNQQDDANDRASRQRAQKQAVVDRVMRDTRQGIVGTARQQRLGGKDGLLFRVLYDCGNASELPGRQVRSEGEEVDVSADGGGDKDGEGRNVWEAFANTFKFFNDVLGRNSIDDMGVHLVGSIHYDDEMPPPGYDNAFWNGTQMVFGDGDPDIFEDFTRSPDVIAHELTHGVTQYTANLPYHFQAGALNESMSDCFGSMVKQYKGGVGSETVEEADWLIGEGIFYSGLEGVRALRSMKAPGTAYGPGSVIGVDRQPGHMKDYVDLPDTEEGDSGGVHINSGIPNKAFYLACVKIGGYAWEIAGKVWYDCLLDPSLKTFAANSRNWKSVFPYFAGLTVQHAERYGADVQQKVGQAWQEVGVQVGGQN